MIRASSERRSDVIADRRAYPRVAVDSGALKERRRGRRLRSDEPSRPFMIRLTPKELARIEAAAEVERKAVADYCRDVLMSESEDLLEESPNITK